MSLKHLSNLAFNTKRKELKEARKAYKVAKKQFNCEHRVWIKNNGLTAECQQCGIVWLL
jgi:hypothetical protein